MGVNGWVMVDGQKMSKSLGNMIPLRDMEQKFGVDASRFTILSGGEGLDDPNWDSAFATALKQKLHTFYELCLTWYGKGRDNKKPIDVWMESRLHESFITINQLMDETLFRSASQEIFFGLQKIVLDRIARVPSSLVGAYRRGSRFGRLFHLRRN